MTNTGDELPAIRNETGRSPDGSGSRASHEAASASSPKASIPNALERSWDWEVGPCLDRLGNVRCWDINIRPQLGDRGGVVIASVYSGEEVARAILAACQATTEHPLVTMTRLDEELGLYDDDAQEGAA